MIIQFNWLWILSLSYAFASYAKFLGHAVILRWALVMEPVKLLAQAPTLVLNPDMVFPVAGPVYELKR